MKEYGDGDPDKQYDKLRRGRPIQERLAKELHRQAGEKEGPCGIEEPWIIERLERKLADAIGSNLVEKCDVTLSRAIPTSFDVLRVLCFLAYFTISVFDYTYWPRFEVKDEEDLLLEKTVRGYKTGRGKRQSK